MLVSNEPQMTYFVYEGKHVFVFYASMLMYTEEKPGVFPYSDGVAGLYAAVDPPADAS